MTPIEIFGQYLKQMREENNFSLKSFAYQIDLSLLEYSEVEEGLTIKYMTGLRAAVAPYLLHINEIPNKRDKFKELYNLAIEYQKKLDEELFPSQRVIPIVPESHSEIDQMVNEMDGI